MSASQLRQQLSLNKPEIPWVVTGYEKAILDSYRLMKSGTVKFIHDSFIILETDTGEWEFIKLSPHEEAFCEVGQHVEEDDIIVVPRGFTAWGDVEKVVAFGINVYTSIMSHPLAYEDGYVISSHVTPRFSSFKVREEIIILKDNEFIVPSHKNGFWLPQPDSVFPKFSKVLEIIDLSLRKRKVVFETDIQIIYSDIIPNKKINPDLPGPFRGFLARKLKEKEDIVEFLRNKGVDEKTLFDVSCVLGLQGDLADKQKDWSAVIKIVCKEKHDNISIGDKITNRHAGKGVVSLICEEDTMPICYPDFQRTEVILNPMSIISRMNVGTFYELITSRIIYYFNKKISKLVKSGNIEQLFQELITFYSTIDYSDSKFISKYIMNVIEDLRESAQKRPSETEEFLKRTWWPFVAPPYECPPLEIIENLAFKYIPNCYFVEEFIETPNKSDFNVYSLSASKREVEVNIEYIKDIFSLSEENILEKYHVRKTHPFIEICRNPKTGTFHFLNSGWLYYMKLVHLAEYKISARSVGKLSSKYLQPKREFKDTGQRVGEMETLCLISYDSLPLLYDILTKQSDDFVGKMGLIFNTLFDSNTKHLKGTTATLELIQSYLNVFDPSLKSILP